MQRNEQQEKFIQGIKTIRDCWLSLPDKTAEEIVDGVLFSTFVMIDGDSSANDFHALAIIDRETNERIDCGHLHELYFKASVADNVKYFSDVLSTRTMLTGIVYNWKGLKEENYLYTLDEMAKYDFELLKDCLNNPEGFNDSSKAKSADKTWMGRLLKTEEEVSDFLKGGWNDDTELLKWENPDTDYSDWYWENVRDNDLYGEKSGTMKQALKRFGLATSDNHSENGGKRDEQAN